MKPNLCMSLLQWKKNTCPPVSLNNVDVSQADSAKYLGLHLDRRLTWKKHLTTKRKQLQIKFFKVYWLVGKNSKLSLNNKILIYKTIFKPVWTYGIQLWVTACKSSINIIQRFQSKALRIITGAPWYVTKDSLHNDLNLRTVKEEITKFSEKYLTKLDHHLNHLAVNLLDNSSEIRRLKRHTPLDLPHWFSDN